MNTKTKIKAPECLCGCGGRTKGGRFLPGHDAKLKKALVADARAGKERAASKLEKLGWSKFLQEHPKSSTSMKNGCGWLIAPR